VAGDWGGGLRVVRDAAFEAAGAGGVRKVGWAVPAPPNPPSRL
jgi:hypothetical protein